MYFSTIFYNLKKLTFSLVSIPAIIHPIPPGNSLHLFSQKWRANTPATGCIFLRGASFQGVSVIQCLRYLLPGGHERQYRAMILEPAPEPADPATGHRPDRPLSDRPHLR